MKATRSTILVALAGCAGQSNRTDSFADEIAWGAAEAAEILTSATPRTVEITVETLLPLFSSNEGEASSADVSVAEARLEVTKADRDHVQTLLQYTKVRAPFDGVVTRRNVSLMFATVAHGVGGFLRRFQTGYLRSYILFLVLAAIGLFALLKYLAGVAAAGQ